MCSIVCSTVSNALCRSKSIMQYCLCPFQIMQSVKWIKHVSVEKPLLNPDWNCLTMTRTHDFQKTNWAIRPATHFLFNNETVLNHNIFPHYIDLCSWISYVTEHRKLNSCLYAVTGWEKLWAWPELKPVTNIRNFTKADLYFASRAPGKNMKMQQTNHFVVDCIFMFSSGAQLLFILCWFSCGTNHPL